MACEVCAECGKEATDLTMVDAGIYVCEHCLDEEYYQCDRCKEWWRYDAVECMLEEDGRTLCAYCAEDEEE
jgi:hypothetical protein